MNDRAAFQVLVLPYRQTSQGTEFALFRRADADCWQGVAGGGEAGEPRCRRRGGKPPRKPAWSVTASSSRWTRAPRSRLST